MSFSYPFSALVAQDDLKLCLMLIAVQPRIGGVLIRGDKGAAKSTAARGIADLLPALEDKNAPFINLPLGASEDRVIGSLDLEHALRGERKLQSGLLGQADSGVLYVDEVNLLADHLVDVLLDAAVTGVNRVERDGLSVEQQSRFSLIGSMNPEEGTLRPQFLDRFGLCVDITAPREVETRADIIRRRMAFEHDPEGFLAQYAEEQENIKTLLARAKTHLPKVTLADAMLLEIAEQCHAAGMSSLRADLVLTRGAVAYAALEGAQEVSAQHVERVAPFVFAHRQASFTSRPPSQQRESSPSDKPKTSPPHPERKNPDRNSGTTNSETDSSHQNRENEESTPSSNPTRTSRPPARAEQTFGIGAASSLPLELVSPRGSKQATDTSRGRFKRSVKTATPQHLAVGDSVRHALTRSALNAEIFDSLSADDLHGYQRNGERERVLFVVDSSGSLAARKRMAQVKGVVARMLESYGQRHEVGLIAFRGSQAQCVVPWTRDLKGTLDALEALPTGGRTPLAHALDLAASMLDGHANVSLALFTDGKSNVPLQSGHDAWQDALVAARRLRKIGSVIVDTEEGSVKLNRAYELAEVMEGNYIPLVAEVE